MGARPALIDTLRAAVAKALALALALGSSAGTITIYFSSLLPESLDPKS